MKNTKKILCVLFALVALTFVMAISAFATEYKVSSVNDFKNAMKNAVDNDVIRFEADNLVFGSSDYFYVDKAITIDLNGKTITQKFGSGSMLIFRNGGASLVSTAVDAEGNAVKGTILHQSKNHVLRVRFAKSVENINLVVDGCTSGGLNLMENANTHIDSIKNVSIYSQDRVAESGEVIKGVLTYGIETYNCGLSANVVGRMENVNVDGATTYGLQINCTFGDVVNCSFEGEKAGIFIWTKGGYTADINLVDCEIKGGETAIAVSINEAANGSISFTADDTTTLESTSGTVFTTAQYVEYENVSLDIDVDGFDVSADGKVVCADEHNMKEATCTEAATCTVCAHKEGEALGHSYVETNRVDATLEAEGSITSTCSVCGDTKTETIPKLVPTVFEVATYDEFYAAHEAAKDGDIILLTADIENAYTGTSGLQHRTVQITKAVTVDFNGKTFTIGKSNWQGLDLRNGGAVLKNGTLKYVGRTSAIRVWNADKIEDLTILITYDDSKNEKTITGISIQNQPTVRINEINNVTIKGEYLTQGIETYNCGNATQDVIGSMTNVTIEANDKQGGVGMIINAPVGTVSNCTISGANTGIQIWTKGGYNAKMTLDDCDVYGGTQSVLVSINEAKNGSISFAADEATTFESTTGKVFTTTQYVDYENVTVNATVPGYEVSTDGKVVCTSHTYSSVVTDPTCTTTGYTTHTCSVCGDTYKDNEVAATGHNYIETNRVPATTEAAGSVTYTCPSCGDSYTEELPKIEHTCSFVESSRQESTCTVAGSVTYTCTCGDSYSEALPLATHTEVKIPAIPSTSKTTGMTSGFKCSVCDTVTVEPKTAVTGFKVNASLSLGEDISMYINVLIPTENGLLVEGSYVVAEFPEITLVDTLQTITESKYDASTGRYKFRFTSTKAQFMTDTMTFTAYACDENGIESAYNVPAYSMVQYIVGLYKTAKANNDTKQVTLLSDLIELGSATQIFMGYKADTLVTAVAEEMLGYEIAPSTFVAPTNSVAKVDRDGKDTSLVDFRTFGLRLGNVMKPTLYFEDKGDLTGYTVKVFVDGVEQETVYGDLDTLETDANGRRILEISSGIKVLAYDKDIVAKFYDANGNETGSVITISVNSYFALNYSKSSANEQAFMRAIYNYGASADAFFN